MWLQVTENLKEKEITNAPSNHFAFYNMARPDKENGRGGIHILLFYSSWQWSIIFILMMIRYAHACLTVYEWWIVSQSQGKAKPTRFKIVNYFSLFPFIMPHYFTWHLISSLLISSLPSKQAQTQHHLPYYYSNSPSRRFVCSSRSPSRIY